jgi:UDP-N-acetylmuramate dehydrogenase
MYIQKNSYLSNFTTYKIGGSADLFISTRSRNELKEAVLYALDHNVPYFVLGVGANILVSDKGFRGLVIRNLYNDVHMDSYPTKEIRDPNTHELIETKEVHFLRAGSGAMIDRIIHYTRNRDFSGFEHFAGIPSTVGGSLWQNLHFLNPERDKTLFISDIVHHAHSINTKTGNENFLFQHDFKFGYDTSILHEGNHIILDAVFSLEKSNFHDIGTRMCANLEWRKERHPPVDLLPSCGSVFKKTMYQGEMIAAAKLIDQAGLKGYSKNDAMISNKHPNFITNHGSAKAEDVIHIIRHIRKVVFDKFGVLLEPEIQFVGEFDDPLFS